MKLYRMCMSKIYKIFYVHLNLMLGSLAMNTKKRIIQEEIIAKKKELRFITTHEITDSLRVDLESK